jgi:parallel beta-helix repeat protein
LKKELGFLAKKIKKIKSMKKIVILLFFFFTHPVFAATYNIGPGETYETYATFIEAVSPVAGDIIDGGGHTFLEKWTVALTGESGNYITLQNAIVDCENIRDKAIEISATNYLTLKNIETKNCTSTGISGYYDYFTGDGIDGIVFDNIYSHNNLGGGLGMGNHFNHRKISGVIIRNSRFDYNGGGGLSVTGHVDGVDISNTTADHNGSITALGAFYFGSRTQHATTGWTNDGGGIYHRQIKTDDIDYETVYRCANATDFELLRENIATPASPVAGEWGFVTEPSHTLYIHLGADANPEGKDLVYTPQKCTNITIDGSTTSNQQRPGSSEGHGLMADDWTDNIHITNHKSFGNVSSGYTLNRATNSTIRNSVGYDNVYEGAWFGPYSINNKMQNNTFWNNGNGIWFFGSDSGNIAQNNIIANSSGYGIAAYSDFIPSEYTSSNNLTFNNIAGNLLNITNSSGRTDDPLLNADGTLVNLSPAIDAGMDIGLDFYGSAPDIGAFEYISTSETCTDNIQNQDETGIDCGGVCEACIIPPTTYGLSNFISAITIRWGVGNETSDVNSDGVVNTRDLGVMMSNWGE